MGQQIIRQPDGRLAVFSSVVDAFIVVDATPEKILDWRAEEAAAKERERRGDQRMSGPVQMPEPMDVEQAVVNFDRAMHDPARRSDAMGDLFTALGAAAQEASRLKREAREAARLARKNDPVTRANRAAGARKGWEKRRAREARDRLLAEIDNGPARTGPACDEMAHNSIGSEVFCQLDPGHDDDHDNDNGTTWERED